MILKLALILAGLSTLLPVITSAMPQGETTTKSELELLVAPLVRACRKSAWMRMTYRRAQITIWEFQPDSTASSLVVLSTANDYLPQVNRASIAQQSPYSIAVVVSDVRENVGVFLRGDGAYFTTLAFCLFDFPSMTLVGKIVFESHPPNTTDMDMLAIHRRALARYLLTLPVENSANGLAK